MITQITKIPVTANSVPFASASETCRFDEIGYIEDEFFLSGRANVYQEGAQGRPEILFAGAPYTTRILVRRPVDTQSFSGNVVLEILNSTAGIDIDRMWVNSWKHFTRSGDIYAGITSKGHVVESLLKFDPERYAPIHWANPLPDREPPKDAPSQGPFRFLPQFESGLFWDMLIDCARLLLDDGTDNPIAGYHDRHLFLTGWSQSGFYIARYLKSFYDREHPLFSGYLSAGSGAGASPLNAYEPNGAPFGQAGLPQSSLIGAPEPFIAINTESENRLTYWYGDFDEPDFKFRTYQIAGASHDSKYNLIDYYGDAGLKALSKIGIFNAYSGVDGDPLDYPYEVIFNAAFHHLFAWARQGIPAPHAPKIETYIAYERSKDPLGSYADNKRDAFGNCKGGIRTPAIEFPTATYTSFSTDKDGKVNPMFGKTNPFPPNLLTQLYRDIDHYRNLVTQATDEAIALGFILPQDRAAFILHLVQSATDRGLS